MKGLVFKKLCCDRAELWGWGLGNETRKLDEGQIAPDNMADLFKTHRSYEIFVFQETDFLPRFTPEFTGPLPQPLAV